MLEKSPITLSKEKSEIHPRLMYVTELRDGLVDRANSLYLAFRDSRFLPLRVDTPVLSGDDEHLWIGLAP